MRIIGRSFFSSPDVDPVLATYRNTVASLGLTFRDPVEVPTWTIKDDSLAMNRLLESDHPPGAVIGATDALALGAVRAAKEHGLAIGSDIAITGYSETDVSSLAEPGPTTVRLPAKHLGYTAMQLLLGLMAGESVDPVTELTGTLVIRESCGIHV